MSLPTIGFVLPNQDTIDAGGIGHCKAAREYINSHGLYEKYINANVSAEDEFLIENCGAVKVAVYRGVRYLYVTNLQSWYTKQIVKLYKQKGYEICILTFTFNSILKEGQEIKHEEERNCIYNYSKTVVKTVKSDGTIQYMYNPEREGD